VEEIPGKALLHRFLAAKTPTAELLKKIQAIA